VVEATGSAVTRVRPGDEVYFCDGGFGVAPGTGNSTGRPDSGDWNKYLDYMNAQLRELLTNYGEVGGIWFDGMWDKPNADWKLGTTYGLIHQLQPAALVGGSITGPDTDPDLGLSQAAEAYELFDSRADGVLKVLLTPNP